MSTKLEQPATNLSGDSQRIKDPKVRLAVTVLQMLGTDSEMSRAQARVILGIKRDGSEDPIVSPRASFEFHAMTGKWYDKPAYAAATLASKSIYTYMARDEARRVLERNADGHKANER